MRPKSHHDAQAIGDHNVILISTGQGLHNGSLFKTSSIHVLGDNNTKGCGQSINNQHINSIIIMQSNWSPHTAFMFQPTKGVKTWEVASSRQLIKVSFTMAEISEWKHEQPLISNLRRVGLNACHFPSQYKTKATRKAAFLWFCTLISCITSRSNWDGCKDFSGNRSDECMPDNTSHHPLGMRSIQVLVVYKNTKSESSLDRQTDTLNRK